MNEKMREEFENAWAEVMLGDDSEPGRKPLRSLIDTNQYRGGAVNFAWKWWKRSRAAIEVELPVIRAEDYDPLGNVSYREECRKAIEAAGLKVKP